MVKRFAFAMGVADEVLCRFGQVENGLEVDDLAAGIADGWVGLREKFQIPEVFLDAFFVKCLF